MKGIAISFILLVLTINFGCKNQSSVPKEEIALNDTIRLTVYHIGNSLTRNVPLERLQMLIESEGGTYNYGMQLGGGHQLDQHLSKRNHNNKPGEGSYNTKTPFGEYDNAFKNFNFDAVILQSYNSILDKEIEITEDWPYFEAGAIQAASEFVDYAMGNTELGEVAWHLENANTNNKATEKFYIYATWPKADQIINFDGEQTYSAFYSQPSENGSVHCKDYFEQLVNKLNQMHPELKYPVRLIPAGQVLAELDIKIRNNNLAGIVNFFERNQSYYLKSRRNNSPLPVFNPDNFQAEKGVLNFYADNVHMNDQPHNGEDSGTIGSYCAALTIYAVLGNKNPVGLTADPYEMFDPEKDAELIKSIQETVWEVVTNESLTGVKK